MSYLYAFYPFLLKPRTTQNQPKPAEANRNDPKKIAKQPKTKLTAQMPKFGCFGPRSINFLFFLGNFACSLFWMYWFQVRHWFLKIFRANPRTWTFWVKKYQLFNLNKTLPVPDFESADFKSDLLTFWISKFKHFWAESINFFILTKFPL